MFGVDPPLQAAGSVHSTEPVNVPAPSAMTAGDMLVNPERPPGMITFD